MGGGGGWARDHGSLKTSRGGGGVGGLGKRPWVSLDRWVGEGWVRDHGSLKTDGGRVG